MDTIRMSNKHVDGKANIHDMDEIDRLVHAICLECPGIGNTALRERVQHQLPPTTVVTRQRIKRQKALLPYHYSAPNDVLRHPKHEFIVQKLQERTSLRMERRFQEADYIHAGLAAMGIAIDDHRKTWTVATVVVTPSETDDLSVSNGVACEFCGRYFASRNLVFKHLRDPSSGCGGSIFASGQALEEAPSTTTKRTRQQQHKKTAIPRAPGKTARYAPALHSIWLGDIPVPWTRPTGRYKRLRAVLFAHLPSSIQKPWIKKVIRKGYREKTSGEYRGYAILVFRNHQEATAAREALDGMNVTADNTFRQLSNEVQGLESFILKVRAVDNDDIAPAETVWECSGEGGRDPPLQEQLRPLDLRELLQRVGRIQGSLDTPNGNSLASADGALYHQQHQEAIDELVSLSTKRNEVHLQGRAVPKDMCNRLLGILESLQWPARNERPRLTSERYLVLPTNVADDRFYGELRQACRNLMDWADPEYYYSGVAVTKNFVASPHMDIKDQNYQYALALGDFEGGGQLCVENGDDCVNVVDTHGRVAQVDGRYVHWVRTWDRGDRYSLIFYDTSDEK